MARRRRTSTAEDFMDVIALMPWWGGVALAVVLYLGLHWYAEQPLPAATTPGQPGPALTQIVFRALAIYGQYVLPFACLIGAALSVWRRRKRTRLLVDVTNSAAADSLQGVRWQEFEQLVGEACRREGHRVTETGDGSATASLTRASSIRRMDEPPSFPAAADQGSEPSPLPGPVISKLANHGTAFWQEMATSTTPTR